MAYVFEPRVLQALAREAIATGQSTEEMIANIRERLSDRYPGHVRANDAWVFNIAGGAMGQMTILHASIREYVIVFGTPIGTEGYSGRFLADDYFIILEGEQWAYREGELDRQVFRPGEMHHLPRGEARGYRMPDRCYALEYARGWIPTMLPFGLADSLTSAVDIKPVLKTLRLYAGAAVGELLHRRT